MNTVLIAYDLNKPGQQYKELIEAIKTLGPWCHVLESTWLVKTNNTPIEIGNFLLSRIDKSDALFISALKTAPPAFGYLSKVRREWVENNVFSE